FGNLAPGAYELTWSAVEGWVRPWPHTVAVEVGEEPAMISGEYRENVPSTVVLEGDADAAGAAWTLRGSEGLVLQGVGTAVLADVDAGRYEITWSAPAGWLNTGPTRQAGTVFGDELTFSAGFVVDVDLPAGFEYVPAGTFSMGSPADEWGRQSDEDAHEVTLTNDYMIAAREVTALSYANLAAWALDQGHARWDSLFLNPDTTFFTVDSFTVRMDTIVTLFDNLGSGRVPLLHPTLGNLTVRTVVDSLATAVPSQPATGMNWFGAAAYCDWLNLQGGLALAYDHDTWLPTGADPYAVEGYRLPTEAEWEYAARAGETDAFSSGPVVNPICDDPNLQLVGWHCDGAMHDVARKLPSGWGLYDMHGNAWEWCADGWDTYPEGPVTDPYVMRLDAQELTRATRWEQAPPADLNLAAKVLPSAAIVRGGSALDFAMMCRSANRGGYDAFWAHGRLGFRPVRTLPPEEGR
ncbi:formylglycine-generating enzyme family protein, partial [bacterium]|nr:formylglycine-generating enzyme family protein [bacterium]